MYLTCVLLVFLSKRREEKLQTTVTFYILYKRIDKISTSSETLITQKPLLFSDSVYTSIKSIIHLSLNYKMYNYKYKEYRSFVYVNLILVHRDGRDESETRFVGSRKGTQ